MCSTHPEFSFIDKFNPVNFQHTAKLNLTVKHDVLMLDIANWWVLEFLRQQGLLCIPSLKLALQTTCLYLQSAGTKGSTFRIMLAFPLT